jgi:hypothetical protein
MFFVGFFFLQGALSLSVLLADPSVECWVGKHRVIAAASAAALTFYVSLSVGGCDDCCKKKVAVITWTSIFLCSV